MFIVPYGVCFGTRVAPSFTREQPGDYGQPRRSGLRCSVSVETRVMTASWLLFALFFATLWCGISLLLSFGGWRALARAYPGDASADGTPFRFQSARIGIVNYNRSLHVIVSPSTLHLVPFSIFRIGHSPMAIPLRDISAEVRQSGFQDLGILRMSKQPGIIVRVRRGLLDEIAAASHGQLHVTPPG
jgi:hypothetical protein